MIRLRADWHQACPSCGTELVVNFLSQCPTEHVCPWCGTRIRLQAAYVNGEARERLKQELSDLEARVNAEMSDGTD
jgi:transcription initiation factor IIE alpha subunit